jgi:hypothetical protein
MGDQVTDFLHDGALKVEAFLSMNFLISINRQEHKHSWPVAKSVNIEVDPYNISAAIVETIPSLIQPTGYSNGLELSTKVVVSHPVHPRLTRRV